MRKILLLIGLVVSFAASSQVKQLYNQYGGTWKRLEVKVGFRLPMNDSSTKDFNSAAFDSAQVYYDPVDSTIKYYTGFQWLSLSPSASVNIYNSNGILSGSRTLTGLNNTRSLTFDSLDYFSVNRNGVIRMYMSSAMSSLYSPNGVNSIIVNNSYPYLNFNGGVNYLRVLDTTLLHARASYEGNIHSTFYPYSLVDKSYVDSVAGGGGTSNWEQVLTAGQVAFGYSTLSTSHDVKMAGSNTLNIYRDVSGGAYQAGLYLADSYAFLNSANTTTKNSDMSANSGSSTNDMNVKLTVQDGSTKDTVALYPGVFKWNQDTVATRAYARSAGGGGVTSVGSGFGTNFSTITSSGSVVVDSTSGGVTSSVRTKKIIDSLSAAGWGAQTVNYEPWYTTYLSLTGPANSGIYFTSVGSGTSILNLDNSTIIDSWQYGQKQSTGTTNAGLCYYYAAAIAGSAFGAVAINSSFRYNTGEKIRFEDLSTVSERYVYYNGFINDVSAFSSVTNGAGFRYADTDSSGVWIAWTKAGGSLTESATSTTVAADTDYETEVSIIGGSAYFYINKVLVKTISTNVPSGTTQYVFTGSSFKKTIGTTARLAYKEWMAYGKRRN